MKRVPQFRLLGQPWTVSDVIVWNMAENIALERPLLIFDGHCGFCRIWIDYLNELTGTSVDYAPSQEAAARFQQIPPESFAKSVQLVMPHGEILAGAHAVFQLLAYAPGRSWPLRLYETLPGFAPASELAYRVIAAHRSAFYWITVVLWGKRVRPLTYQKIEWLFLRALALIYLAAFLSFGVQIRGLIGSRGILPAADFLEAVSQSVGPARAWRLLPSLFWIWHSDPALTWSCIAGAALAVVLLLGFFQRTCLVALFLLYLSLCSVGQDFLSFQWDMLLLEAGFLAIFLGSSTLVVWLYRLLLFRLMFSSGVVKLLSGDPNWRSLRAMDFQYFTQPIPTPLAWYMQQLPAWFQTYSTAGVFFIELLVPFCVFMPRRIRHAGAVLLILFQILILTTGNYAFFNWLTIALCLFLFDDFTFPRVTTVRHPRPLWRPLTRVVTVLVIVLGLLQLLTVFGRSLPAPEAALLQFTSRFGIVNSYGLFAVMTTTRPEIAVQGSNDGVNWLTYEFKYKAGPLARRPPWVAPYQPRLDWQMWFAALGPYQSSPWFANFVVRLLQGSPTVLRLLEKNPFPNAPPKYVRAVIAPYEFTTWAERRATGNWWKSTPAAPYLPAVSLADVRR